MDYNTIKTTAYGYADRSDKKSNDQYDNFLRIVESRVNRFLKVSDMSMRAKLDISSTKSYYGLPLDFAGLRKISTYGETSNATFEYLSPHQVDSLYEKPDIYYYSIEAKQLRIYNPPDLTVEITYYQRLIPLSDTAPSNWLSTDNPDVYVFGLLTEINAYVKDPDASTLWDARFKEALDSIKLDDATSRWSGTPMVQRLG